MRGDTKIVKIGVLDPEKESTPTGNNVLVGVEHVKFIIKAFANEIIT